ASIIDGLPIIENDLTGTIVGNALDSTQGKILKDLIDGLPTGSTVTIENDLTGTTTGNALDATQGKVLKDSITTNYNLITGLTLNITNNYIPYTGATKNINLSGNTLTATAFIKSGGTSNQILMADGS